MWGISLSASFPLCPCLSLCLRHVSIHLHTCHILYIWTFQYLQYFSLSQGSLIHATVLAFHLLSSFSNIANMSVGWGLSRDAHFPSILGGSWERQGRTLESKSLSSNVRHKTEMKPTVLDNGLSLIISFFSFFFQNLSSLFFACVFSVSALLFSLQEGYFLLLSTSAVWPLLFKARAVFHDLHLIWTFKRIIIQVTLWVCASCPLGCSS